MENEGWTLVKTRAQKRRERMIKMAWEPEPEIVEKEPEIVEKEPEIVEPEANNREMLYKNAASQNWYACIELLSKGDIDDDEGSALMWAASYGNTDMVERLLGMFAYTRNHASRALYSAVVGGKLGTIRLLLDFFSGVDYNYDDLVNDDCVRVSIKDGSYDIFRLLVSRLPKSNMVGYLASSMYHAVAWGRVVFFEGLISAGVCVYPGGFEDAVQNLDLYDEENIRFLMRIVDLLKYNPNNGLHNHSIEQSFKHAADSVIEKYESSDKSGPYKLCEKLITCFPSVVKNGMYSILQSLSPYHHNDEDNDQFRSYRKLFESLNKGMHDSAVSSLFFHLAWSDRVSGCFKFMDREGIDLWGGYALDKWIQPSVLFQIKNYAETLKLRAEVSRLNAEVSRLNAEVSRLREKGGEQ